MKVCHEKLNFHSLNESFKGHSFIQYSILNFNSFFNIKLFTYPDNKKLGHPVSQRISHFVALLPSLGLVNALQDCKELKHTDFIYRACFECAPRDVSMR